jgi:TPR repeat protein
METELADLNNLNDLYELGVMYYYGLKVQKDKLKAIKIFVSLSNKMHIRASIMLKQIRNVNDYRKRPKRKNK